MDFSAIFQADVVVFGCGNVLFGDDGLAPRAVALLAEEAAASGRTEAAFVDAGTSIRALLTDLALTGARARRVVVADVVQEAGRAPGSMRMEILGAPGPESAGAPGPESAGAPGTVLVETLGAPGTVYEAASGAESACAPERQDMAGGWLHHAPTWGLLRRLRDVLGMEVVVLTVQAGHIPPCMDDSLSPAAREALPRLMAALRAAAYGTGTVEM